ncbi:MAG: twin-arginine translocase TatA/TatE family subunit [Chthoniobacterales bacterium]|nr:twin-arginine translocase TatA/TatE family subunit [Chthoniobacterales bacterium]
MNFSSSFFLAFGLPAAPEWLFIGILALVLFGPKKLPSLARGLAQIFSEFQKAKEEFHRAICELPPLPKIQEPPEKKPFQATPALPATPEVKGNE